MELLEIQKATTSLPWLWLSWLCQIDEFLVVLDKISPRRPDEEKAAHTLLKERFCVGHDVFRRSAHTGASHFL